MTERKRWVRDPEWQLLANPDQFPCSFPRCPKRAVATMSRRHAGSRSGRRLYRYCVGHTYDYGRRIAAGIRGDEVQMYLVVVESSGAKK